MGEVTLKNPAATLGDNSTQLAHERTALALERMATTSIP